MNQELIDKFIKDLLDAKDLNGVDDEVRQQLEQDLKTRLLDQIDRAIIEALPEDKLSGFNALLDNNSTAQDVQKYIIECGVDTQKVTLETMLRFRALYLGSK